MPEIIIKTNMSEVPTDCKKCEYVSIGYGLILCPIVHNWIEVWEYNTGRKKLDNCPLETV